MQNVRAVKEQIQQQQRPEKVEIRVAHHRQQERAVASPGTHCAEKLADEIRAKLFHRVGRRDTSDAEAGGQSKKSQGDQDRGRPDVVPAEMAGHECRGDRAENDGRERAELKKAVAP